MNNMEKKAEDDLLLSMGHLEIEEESGHSRKDNEILQLSFPAHPPLQKINCDEVNIAEDENCKNLALIPAEADGTLFAPLIRTLFPEAIGLQYKEGGYTYLYPFDIVNIRPPIGGWGPNLYVCVMKRLTEDFCTMETDFMANENNSFRVVVKNFGYDTTICEIGTYFYRFFCNVESAELLENSEYGVRYAIIGLVGEGALQKVLETKHRIKNFDVMVELLENAEITGGQLRIIERANASGGDIPMMDGEASHVFAPGGSI